MKIVSSGQMKKIEQRSEQMGVSTGVLMENAGRAVASEVKNYLGDIEDRKIVILVGPGNNGGDGLAAAYYLSRWGANINVYLTSPRKGDDINYDRLIENNIPVIEAGEDTRLKILSELLEDADMAVDAVFGTGSTRPITGIFEEVLGALNRARQQHPRMQIAAVDLPSGLNADTGQVDPACPRADLTVTLGYPKTGLFAFPGAEYLGTLAIVDIGIPGEAADDVTLELITEEFVKRKLPARPLSANKGTFGRVLVMAGSRNYVGSAYLACQAALRVGAGLVTLAVPESLHPILASKLTEVTYIPLPEKNAGNIHPDALKILAENLSDVKVLLAGCGLGQSPSTQKLVKWLLLEEAEKYPLSVILDADGLNILSTVEGWWQQIKNEVVITPHPGEMSRLTGLTVAEIQSDRIEIARRAASRFNKVVVLKGAFTMVASPDGKVMLSGFANPGLATAGTGDVLAGAIAGMVAQGLPLFDAAACGVYLHATAGEEARQQLGDAGIIASDLLPLLPKVIKNMKEIK